MTKFRKTAKDYAVSKRYLAISVIEIRNANKIANKIRRLCKLMAFSKDPIPFLGKIMLLKREWRGIVCEDESNRVPRPIIKHFTETIEDIPDSLLVESYRFRSKDQLKRLFNALKVHFLTVGT